MLAMQAAGMITDFFGARNQADLQRMGMKVQQAGIEANIYQSRLETEEQSLNNMKNLRQTVGSQIAAFAARGTALGAGTAVSLLNESQSNFNADERVRKLNAMGKENQLRAGKVNSFLNYQSENSKLWQGFASRTFNKFPSSVSGWKQGISDFKEGFGLTSIGGA